MPRNGTEWSNFKEGWDIISNLGIPWQLVPGNHDLHVASTPFAPDRWKTWNEQVGPYYQHNTGLESTFPEGTVDSTAVVFEGGGVKFIVIGLELGPTEATFAWAKAKLDQYSDHRAIIVNHFLEFSNDIPSWALKSRNVFMIHMGHECAREWNKQVPNNWGDMVQIIMTDYQCSGAWCCVRAHDLRRTTTRR